MKSVMRSLFAVISPVVLLTVQASASITWSPRQVQIVAIPGTLQVVHVTFSSGSAISAATVRIVPELAPYVSTDISSFPQLQAGNVYELNIIVSLPRGLAVSKLDGTIQLKSASKNGTLSIPLPIAITTTQPSNTAAAAPAVIALPSYDRLSIDPDLPNTPFVQDEVDIIFSSSADNSAIDSVVNSIGGEFIGSVPASRFYQIQVASTTFEGLLSLAEALKQNSLVFAARPHLLYRPDAWPNDPGTGQSYSPMLINLPKAWDITIGHKTNSDGSILGIGVIDNVFDFSHQDLSGNIAKHDNNTAPFSLIEGSHGTRVASIAGAVGNNSLGIAGAMWNASLYLYPVGYACAGPACGYSPPLPGLVVANDTALETQRIYEAISDNVRVVNMSFGADCRNCTAGQQDAINTSVDWYKTVLGGSGKNVLWIFSAGNSGVPLSQSIANVSTELPNVMAVSAVDGSSSLANFSDYGTGVIAAPGVDLLSDIPGGSYDNGVSCVLLLGCDHNASGTSFSAPHVTGVAGLMLSVNPNLTASELKQMILASAQYTVNEDPGGNNVMLLDAYSAVLSAQQAANTLPAVLDGIGLNARAVTGGSSLQGFVYVDSPAPSEGLLLTLSTNNIAAQVPPSVIIAGGQTSAPFTITTSGVAAQTNVKISASYAQQQVYTAITLWQPGGDIITTVAGNGAQGYSGDGVQATSSSLSYPRGVAFDTNGNMYIADTYNNRIRKVSAQSGIITTVAGNGTPGFGGDGGLATAAMLSFVTGVAVDSSGNIYIADFSNERIRRVDAATGIISTVAGNGGYGYSGDSGLAISAELKSPENVTVDSRGNVYIADFGNGRVRAVNVATKIITTVAGNGSSSSSPNGDGGLATNAPLDPYALTFDKAGNLYIADVMHSSIRKVNAATGIISTASSSGDYPQGVAVDAVGNIFISGEGTDSVLKVDAVTGEVTDIGGNDQSPSLGDGGLAANARIDDPEGLALDRNGSLFVASDLEHRIRMIGGVAAH